MYINLISNKIVNNFIIIKINFENDSFVCVKMLSLQTIDKVNLCIERMKIIKQ